MPRYLTHEIKEGQAVIAMTDGKPSDRIPVDPNKQTGVGHLLNDGTVDRYVQKLEGLSVTQVLDALGVNPINS